jgi:DNA-directed RNA polymerase specialized sigma24 family protein
MVVNGHTPQAQHQAPPAAGISCKGGLPARASELTEMPIAELAARSLQEMGKYLRHDASVDAYAYELFRRAICERDQYAWTRLYEQYHFLLLGWLRRHPARPATIEDNEALVNRAFSRFWECIGPNRFHTFPCTAALLRYLKVCVHSVALDEARARQHKQRDIRALQEAEPMHAPDPANALAGAVAASELWAVIATELHSEADRIVARHCLVRGLRPREVYDRHPDIYASVEEVYRVKRNVLERLKRNSAVRGFMDEM